MLPNLNKLKTNIHLKKTICEIWAFQNILCASRNSFKSYIKRLLTFLDISPRSLCHQCIPMHQKCSTITITSYQNFHDSSHSAGPQAIQSALPPASSPTSQSDIQPSSSHPVLRPLNRTFSQPALRPLSRTFSHPALRPLIRAFSQPALRPLSRAFSQPALRPLSRTFSQPPASSPATQPVTVNRQPAMFPLSPCPGPAGPPPHNQRQLNLPLSLCLILIQCITPFH